MAPFDLLGSLGYWGSNLTFLALGAGFGAALEMSGFGDSRKLAAQFYLKEMTVLKVMFTGIIVAASLIFFFSALGLLDYTRVWVNPTYLAPEIVGGLIMGVGFIIGGFCPGTSLVAASTLKLDGVAFVLGVATGIFAFGESVSGFESFFLSSFYGRFTLADWLGVPLGLVLAGLIVMALFMFYMAELSEGYFGRGLSGKALRFLPQSKIKVAAALGLLGLALFTALLGQPTPEARWARLGQAGEAAVRSRAIYVDPAEVVELKRDLTLLVNVLDLRSEADFNRFHLSNARRITMDEVRGQALLRELTNQSDNVITFLVSNDEQDATAAYKILRAQNALNLYVIEGGINHWLTRYPLPACIAEKRETPRSPEASAYRFAYAVGAEVPSAHPELARRDPLPACAANEIHDPASEHKPEAAVYTKRVKIQKKTAAKGGCG